MVVLSAAIVGAFLPESPVVVVVVEEEAEVENGRLRRDVLLFLGCSSDCATVVVEWRSMSNRLLTGEPADVLVEVVSVDVVRLLAGESPPSDPPWLVKVEPLKKLLRFLEVVPPPPPLEVVSGEERKRVPLALDEPLLRPLKEERLDPALDVVDFADCEGGGLWSVA